VIKKSLGKLEIPDDIEVILSAAHFDTLPVTAPHAFALQSLPDHHKDPFDRMLIAQAICEGFTLVTRDRMIRKYQVSCIVA
jgi:PIN domain nuclease of toxin-antitoxin system